MVNRLFSENLSEIDLIGNQYNIFQEAIREYYSEYSPRFSLHFTGYTKTEIAQQMNDQLHELDLLFSLKALAATEGILRRDYIARATEKRRDPVSREFRLLYKNVNKRASLEEEILPIWRNHGGMSNDLVSQLKGAMKYRHWLAHGRYWTPKLGRLYDFFTIFQITKNVTYAVIHESIKNNSQSIIG